MSANGLSIVDIIPQSNSAEARQNAEPSIAVNPTNPAQMVAGAFGTDTEGPGTANPYFVSTSGGTAWSDFGSIVHSDKSMAWAVDGSAVFTAVLDKGITLYSVSAAAVTSGGNFGAPINTFTGDGDIDQPWIRTGINSRVYVGYNNLANFGADNGKTASVNVSTDGGVSFLPPITLDRVGAKEGQDSPAVRFAVNGNTAYAVFERWNSDAGKDHLNSTIAVVASDIGGADGFTVLGPGGNGVAAANLITSFTEDGNISDGGTATVSSGGTISGATLIDGGTLELKSGAVVNGGVKFASGGTLQVDGNTIPANLVLSGFALGDTVDLASIAFDSGGTATASGSVVTVTESGQSYNLSFSTDLSGAAFALAPDGGSACNMPAPTQPPAVSSSVGRRFLAAP